MKHQLCDRCMNSIAVTPKGVFMMCLNCANEKFEPMVMAMNANPNELYPRVLSKFGPQHQIDKCLEELAELSLALHHFNAQKMTADSVIQEIADVTIMCEQLAMIFGKSRVEHFKRKKLERLQKMVE